MEILAEALNSLSKVIKTDAVVEEGGVRHDAQLNIAGERFVIAVEPVITKGNKGLVLLDLKNISRENNLPVLLVTRYIPVEIRKEYVEEGINYLDVSGNCNIRRNKLFLLIEGKKIVPPVKANQPRAFREAGIRLLFLILVDPQKIQLPYRNLAALAGISLGSVGMTMQELIDLNFILKTKKAMKLKNTKELLNRWIIAYHDVLRPRLLKKHMRFIHQENYIQWNHIDLSKINGTACWGGEPAANLLTGHLHPGLFTIYTDQSWQTFKDIDLVPDETGNVEVLEMFWKREIFNGVPPVLVYADLLHSSSDRNTETARMIYENELQYLK